MRLLFDFRNYQYFAQRGIGRYILALTEHIARIKDVNVSILVSKDLTPVIFSKDLEKKIPIYTIENFDNYEIQKNFDFFFKGNYFEPLISHEYMYPKNVLKKCNDIVGILYDFIPLIFAKNYLPSKQTQEHYLTKFEELKYTSHFFTISDCTASDAIKYLNLPKENFTTIYGGADFEKFNSPNSNKEYVSSERKNNIIFVSGDDKRKNYHGAAKAFALAYESGNLPHDAKLYLACKSSENFVNNIKNELKGYNAKIGEQIIITNYIPDEELVDLLATAKASIFPSFYEGLGLPIIESYIAGTPSFASNLSSTKEFVNQESSFSPYDMEEMKNVIIRMQSSCSLSEKS